MAFDAYPNPVSETLQISIESKNSSSQLKIYNAQGIALREEKLNSLSLNYDISNLPNGVYYLNIVNGEQRQTKKIIKEGNNF